MARLLVSRTSSARLLFATVLSTLAGCEPIPEWQLQLQSAGAGDEGGFTTCADASDIACAPFGSPIAVAEIASLVDDDEKPTLTSDMLELFFLSYRPAGPGSGDVWYSTRAAVTSPWGAPILLSAVDTSSRETSPALSSDGLTLWVASDRTGGQGGLDIWISTRPSQTASWASPVLVPALNSTEDEIPRPPGYASRIMPLSRRLNASHPYQIFTASRSSASASWEAPTPEQSVDESTNTDDDGFLTDDGLTLYFSSDRLSGSQDLFVTERPSVSASFAAPRALAELNTDTYTERDPWLSPDGRTIYFSSDRTGALQIYAATR